MYCLAKSGISFTNRIFVFLCQIEFRKPCKRLQNLQELCETLRLTKSVPLPSKRTKLLPLLYSSDTLIFCSEALVLFQSALLRVCEVPCGVPYEMTFKYCLRRSPQSLLRLRRNALGIKQNGQSLSTANTHKQRLCLEGGGICFHFPMFFNATESLNVLMRFFYRDAANVNSNFPGRNINPLKPSGKYMCHLM